jgi:hypothetical protein
MRGSPGMNKKIVLRIVKKPGVIVKVEMCIRPNQISFGVVVGFEGGIASIVNPVVHIPLIEGVEQHLLMIPA